MFVYCGIKSLPQQPNLLTTGVKDQWSRCHGKYNASLSPDSPLFRSSHSTFRLSPSLTTIHDCINLCLLEVETLPCSLRITSRGYCAKLFDELFSTSHTLLPIGLTLDLSHVPTSNPDASALVRRLLDLPIHTAVTDMNLFANDFGAGIAHFVDRILPRFTNLQKLSTAYVPSSLHGKHHPSLTYLHVAKKMVDLSILTSFTRLQWLEVPGLTYPNVRPFYQAYK